MTIIGGLDFTEDLATSRPRATILGVVPTVVRMTPLRDRPTLAEDLALVTNTPLFSCGWMITPIADHLVLSGYGAKIVVSPQTLDTLISELYK